MRVFLRLSASIFLFSTSVGAAPPILELLFNQEALLQGSNKAYHIGDALRRDLRESCGQQISSEDEENKKLENLPGEIRAAKELYQKAISDLAALDQKGDISFKKEQDEYERALSFYKRYFHSKSMLDDERQEEIDYIRSDLKKRRGADRDLESYLQILETQQENESRSFVSTNNEDEFGNDLEQAKDERSDAEKRAFQEVEAADEEFAKIEIKDVEFDYEQAKSKDTTKLASLKNAINKYKAYEKLLAERLTRKATSLRPTQEEMQAAISSGSWYPKEMTNIVAKGTWSDNNFLYDLVEIRRDIEAIENFTSAISLFTTKVKSNLKAAQERARLTTIKEETLAKTFELETELHAAELNRNHFAYLSLACAMNSVSDKIRGEVQSRGPVALQAKTVRDLRIAFLTLMHRLESFEMEMAVKYRGEDPYSNHPIKASIKSVVNYFKGKAVDFFAKDKRPSKKQLMRNYQLALNGLSGFTDAFKATFAKIKDAAWGKNATPLKEYIELSNITKALTSIERFAMEHPILATDMQRNLTHAYKILMQDPKNGALSEVIGIAKMVYEVKEVENIARDWLLGSSEYLYSDQNLGPPVSPEILTLIDMAEVAPYLAGAFVGASGGGTAAGWVESMVTWIPVIGSYKPMKLLAKATGGIAQVQLQKMAAERISRSHELLANTLRRGFEAYFQGQSPKDIALTVVKYQAMRKTIQLLGTARRLGAANILRDAGQCLLKNKGAAAGGAALGLGGGTLVGAGLLTAGGAALLPIIVLPVLATVGCAVGAVAISHKLKDFFIPGRKEGRKMQALAEQLKNVSIPAVNPDFPGISKDELDWVQKELPKAIDTINFKELGKKAQGNEEQLQEIVMKAIQEKLEELEQAHVAEAAQQSNLRDTPDYELDPLKAKLKELKDRPNLTDVEVIGLVGEALKMKGDKERLDIFEISIFDKLAEMQEAVRAKDQPKAHALLTAVQKEVQFLRIRQIEAELVKTQEALQR